MVELVMDLPSALTAAAPEVRARAFPLPRPAEPSLPSESTSPLSEEKMEAALENAASAANDMPSAGARRERILSLEEQYALNLRAMLEAKKSFPTMARKLGKEGRVTLQLVLSASGKVLQSSLAESSGFEVLDQAALGLVEQIGEFPAFPAEIQRSSWQFFIPIEYRL